MPKLSLTKTSTHHKQYDLQIDTFSCIITQKPIRHLYIRISEESKILISSPAGKSMSDIIAFVTQKKKWIQRCLEKIKHSKYSLHLPDRGHPAPVYFNGRAYQLRETASASPSGVYPCHDTIILHINSNDQNSQATKAKLLDNWYRCQLLKQMTALIPLYEKIMKVRVNELRVRHMKTLWGSCQPVKKKICLNTELIKRPKILQEYVLVHEMVHLLERGHGQRFKNLMDRFMPGWRVHKQALG